MKATHHSKGFPDVLYVDVGTEPDSNGFVSAKQLSINGKWSWTYGHPQHFVPIPQPKLVPFDRESWAKFITVEHPGRVLVRDKGDDYWTPAHAYPFGESWWHRDEWQACPDKYEISTDGGVTWRPMAREVTP